MKRVMTVVVTSMLALVSNVSFAADCSSGAGAAGWQKGYDKGYAVGMNTDAFQGGVDTATAASTIGSKLYGEGTQGAADFASCYTKSFDEGFKSGYLDNPSLKQVYGANQTGTQIGVDINDRAHQIVRDGLRFGGGLLLAGAAFLQQANQANIDAQRKLDQWKTEQAQKLLQAAQDARDNAGKALADARDNAVNTWNTASSNFSNWANGVGQNVNDFFAGIGNAVNDAANYDGWNGEINDPSHPSTTGPHYDPTGAAGGGQSR